MEKTTFNASVIHFLLMFGYKLFSLYFPLYLVSIGLSVISVGWVYLLIYATIALSTIATNFWIHKINPAKAASLGILGYGIYALLMLLNPGTFVFYFAQILLGFSSSLWLVSLKSIIIDSHPHNYNNSFGWFYSAPEYASALAPAIGGLVIYKFGFNGVFALSFLIQVTNAIWAYHKLKGTSTSVITTFHDTPIRNPACRQAGLSKTFNLNNLKQNYKEIFYSLRKDKVASFALIVLFIALILGGIFRPYFVLFLKDLNYSQNNIIAFLSLLSISFIPLSWITIKYIGKITSYKNIFIGVTLNGIIFIIIGFLSNLLNIIFLFILLLIDALAGLMAGSGKSGMIAQKFAKFKEEASTIDTILVTLGPGIGSMIGGIVISQIGFAPTFLIGGLTVLAFSLMFYFFTKSSKAKTQEYV